MYLLLDTATPLCRATIILDNGSKHEYEWQADRGLAAGLLGYLRNILAEHGGDLDSLSGIGVYRGPGSYTGLRIGLTVVNTIADGKRIPIVGAGGDDWRDDALRRLMRQEDDRIVLPHYGSDARITTPRK